MDDPHLPGVWAKLERARVVIADLAELVRPTVEACNESLFSEVDGDGIVLRVGDVPASDLHVSAMVGDALFNLRSAWDHLAWRLVLLDGKEPNRQTFSPSSRREVL